MEYRSNGVMEKWSVGGVECCDTPALQYSITPFSREGAH